MPRTESDGPDDVDAPVAGVGHLADQPAAEQDPGDDDRLEHEADAPRQERGQGAADERPDRCRDRARGADQRVHLGLHLALEVAVDQRLHRGQIERGAEAADDGPEDDDRGKALREHHRDGAQRVEDEAGHVGPLAAEEVAQLAADQDEGGRDERLERDRRLNAADGRVEILDHRGDRDVHQRRVDDEDEHRHRQQKAQPRGARSQTTSPRVFRMPRAHQAVRSRRYPAWPEVCAFHGSKPAGPLRSPALGAPRFCVPRSAYTRPHPPPHHPGHR